MSVEKNFKKTFFWVSKYFLPIFLIVIFAQAIYHEYNPWQPAQKALSEYKDYYHFQTGGSYSGNQYHWTKKKAYLLISRENYSSKYLVVTLDSSRKLEVDLAEGGLLIFVFRMVIIIGISFYAWSLKRPDAKK